MKKRTLSLSNSFQNLSQKKLLGAWIIYHAAIAVFFLVSLIVFRGRIGVEADLFNLVPKTISMASVKKADEKIICLFVSSAIINFTLPFYAADATA